MSNSKTLADRIHGDLFIVRVPVIAVHNDEFLDGYGLFVNDSVDKMSVVDHNAPVAVGKTVMELAEIYSNGFTIKLVNTDDLPVIYSLLSDYLYNVDRTLNSSPNAIGKKSNEEELLMLDSFGQEMFDINKKDVILKKTGPVLSEKEEMFEFMTSETDPNYDERDRYTRVMRQESRAVCISDLMKIDY